MNPTSIEDKLAINKYDIDREVHISLGNRKGTSWKSLPLV